MDKYSVYFPFKPVAWARVKGGRHAFYDPQLLIKKNMRDYLKSFECYKDYEMATSPISLTLEFYYKPPKNLSKVKYHALIGKPYDKRVDVTNLAKLIEDAFEGVFWENDCLICEEKIKKFYWDYDGIFFSWREIEKEKKDFPHDLSFRAQKLMGLL